MEIKIIWQLYKGKNGTYLLHPDYRFISSAYTKTFSGKTEAKRYCKIKKLEYVEIQYI